MKKLVLLGMAVALMVFGITMQAGAQGAPKLEKIWAPAEVDFGKDLMVYVKASDPEGNMRWVVVSMGRGTGAPQGSAPIWLHKQSRSEVNGYVYWNTGIAASQTVSGMVYIQIVDWKGNESETMALPVKIVPRGAKSEKPPAEFKQVEIGPIMVGSMKQDMGGH